MKYRFILTYQATDSETTYTRTCFPLHGDDLSISIDRAEGEWYYTRNLDGKLVFERDDYEWIMAREFDGTFTLNIKESHDNGSTWFDYFTGTFSRASLEIDQDNHQATLNGLKEGVEDLIKNGAKEDYDLMKLIPDSYAKEVQGQVPPALALVDECSQRTKVSTSDIYCGMAMQSGGYKEDVENFWGIQKDMRTNPNGRLMGILAEAKVTRGTGSQDYDGNYAGYLNYEFSEHQYESQTVPGQYYTLRITTLTGILRRNDGVQLTLSIKWGDNNNQYPYISVKFGAMTSPTGDIKINSVQSQNTYYSPLALHASAIGLYDAEISIHYIYASLLLKSKNNVLTNILDTGPYYEGMEIFNGIDLYVTVSTNTSEQPNGHRIVPGSDEYGGTPQYFAPPAPLSPYGTPYIPLNENNWNYASLWYTVFPSNENGLLSPSKYGSFRWTRCWTIGTCIKHLLKRITNDNVVFSESTDYSQFLYGNPNPVEGHEPFQWLVTQKSNVMHPAATGAARCIVRLDWFFELLRNAFNCYYWFERRNDGRYDFRIEHVEYFRNGGTYTPNTQDDPPLDLTRLKPYRNFLRNGQPAKRYADQTNRYTFDLDNMVEKYTYSWQGDGGSDDFKGNPMYFRAGWIEKGSIEDRQVDNIFADLGWLMLNAGTETASSKNYDGLFIFGGYLPFDTSQWTENKPATAQYLTDPLYLTLIITITAPAEHTITLDLYHTDTSITETIATYTGTGQIQTIFITFLRGQSNVVPQINFGASYRSVIIHRIQTTTGNVFRVPNVDNLLRDDDSKLQNGVLAWPWLQCEYLHYDIPAAKWTYLKDDYTDNPDLVWETDGTIKMVKKQTLAVVPVPDASTEEAIVDIMGVKTGLGIGIIDNAKINLSSRNAEMTIIYDINPQNQ